MIGVARRGLLDEMGSRAIIGMDSKWDFNYYKFATLLFSFTDECNQGKVGTLFVISKEDGKTVQLALHVVRWQMPCSNPRCAHKILYHSRNDGHGW